MEEDTAIQGQKDNVHMNVILRGTCVTTAAVEKKDCSTFWMCL